MTDLKGLKEKLESIDRLILKGTNITEEERNLLINTMQIAQSKVLFNIYNYCLNKNADITSLTEKIRNKIIDYNDIISKIKYEITVSFINSDKDEEINKSICDHIELLDSYLDELTKYVNYLQDIYDTLLKNNFTILKQGKEIAYSIDEFEKTKESLISKCIDVLNRNSNWSYLTKDIIQNTENINSCKLFDFLNENLINYIYRIISNPSMLFALYNYYTESINISSLNDRLSEKKDDLNALIATKNIKFDKHFYLDNSYLIDIDDDLSTDVNYIVEEKTISILESLLEKINTNPLKRIFLYFKRKRVTKEYNKLLQKHNIHTVIINNYGYLKENKIPEDYLNYDDKIIEDKISSTEAIIFQIEQQIKNSKLKIQEIINTYFDDIDIIALNELAKIAYNENHNYIKATPLIAILVLKTLIDLNNINTQDIIDALPSSQEIDFNSIFNHFAGFVERRYLGNEKNATIYMNKADQKESEAKKYIRK